MKYKGFTLMELMVVIAVMAIFLTLMVGNIGGSRAQNRDIVRVSHIQDIRLALEEYRSSCGEFPNTLELGANNGDCPSGFSLGDVVNELPVNPDYDSTAAFFTSSYQYSNTFNGYVYAGLSNSANGSCYDYHLGVPLESMYNDSSNQFDVNTRYLREDHDCGDGDTPFEFTCLGSRDDFDGNDDQFDALYDYRSANNCQ